jgi:hypothetical protein
MGCDVALKAEAASPLTGEFFWNFTALPMCVGQLLVKLIQ